MTSSSTSRICAAALLGLALTTACFAAPGSEVMTAGEPKLLAGTKGRFDFLAIDPERNRLLAAHTGNNSLDVIDLSSGQLVKAVAVGAAQDCAVDSKSHRYLVSVSKPAQLAVVDAESLEITGKVALGGPADLLAVSATTGLAYVGHDDEKQLWIVNADEKKVTGQVDLPSAAPEDLAFDESGGRLFQAMKEAGTMSVIDTATNKVVANWSTEPAKAPHGIAMVAELKAIVIAGGNGKLVLLSEADGKILASGAIPERVDQIGYDLELKRVYCASALGKMAIFSVEEGKLTKLGEITTPAGAKSLAVDQKTHTVWIAYAKGDAASVQPFTAVK